MTTERSLLEVYERRLKRTRDPELKWLLTELGAANRSLSRGVLAALQAAEEVGQAWRALGLIQGDGKGANGEGEM